MLTAPALTLLFLVIVTCLGAAFVWMFWDIEQKTSKPISTASRAVTACVRSIAFAIASHQRNTGRASRRG